MNSSWYPTETMLSFGVKLVLLSLHQIQEKEEIRHTADLYLNIFKKLDF